MVVRDSIIYGISLNPDDKSNDAMVPVAGLQNGYDVDFDDSEQTIYWVEHPVCYCPKMESPSFLDLSLFSQHATVEKGTYVFPRDQVLLCIQETYCTCHNSVQSLVVL